MSLWNAVCSVHLCYLWEKEHLRNLLGSFSLTELTDLTELFHQRFELTEGLRHTEFTEAFQLRLAVTFCDIGWLDVSVNLCVFCSSVIFCERKNAPSLKDETHVTRWGVLSLTERTEFTEHFCAQFRAHRRPPAYRVHRALLLKVAVRFCEIGWLNVSVGLCVFCSSVFFCEK